MGKYVDVYALGRYLFGKIGFSSVPVENVLDYIADYADHNSADVVEVVRCKDCKYYKRHNPPIEDFDGWCSANEIECDTDFCCQYGKKEGEGK